MSREFDSIELIDQLQLSEEVYLSVFNDLSRLSRLLGTKKRIIQAIKSFVNEPSSFPNAQIRVTDMGCGNADNLKAIDHFFDKYSLNLKLTGIDFNPILIHANMRNLSKGNFIVANVKSPDFELPVTDILLSSHFLYHFKDEELISMLRNNIHKVSKGFVIAELHSGFLWETIFKIIGSMLFANRIIVEDGIKALKKSWTKGELKKLLESSKLFSSIEKISTPFETVLICKK